MPWIEAPFHAGQYLQTPHGIGFGYGSSEPYTLGPAVSAGMGANRYDLTPVYELQNPPSTFGFGGVQYNHWSYSNIVNNSVPISFHGPGGVGLLRIKNDLTNNRLMVEYWTGFEWLAFGEAAPATGHWSNAVYMHVYIKLHATEGEIRVYREDVEVFTFLGNTIFGPGITTVAQVRFYNTEVPNGVGSLSGAGNDVQNYCGLLFADFNIVGHRSVSYNLAGQGFFNEWTNGFNHINSWYGTGNWMISGTDGARSSFTSNGWSSTFETQYEVVKAGVGIVGRAWEGDKNVRFGYNQGGTTFMLSNPVLLQKDWAFHEVWWDQNPATQAQWSITSMDQLQAHVEVAPNT